MLGKEEPNLPHISIADHSEVGGRKFQPRKSKLFSPDEVKILKIYKLLMKTETGQKTVQSKAAKLDRKVSS